ncbi:hypothetical protein [Planctomicrobium piriforme]|uniref:Uncharacterized protein n=1 Tax=Planctomicrobium piriforme TaxID=1576369 RepID=A0A1I3F2U9_9PLAN|nr:hypothetical protein [Planctomicrobium piriforme]SFI05595.1 hypothetical protein SAMN05421753_10561 [Planctomicrobium piriforme]
MTDVMEFAHGDRYGDYSGVVFYGPPNDGIWSDRIEVSDIYLDPLFHGILTRAWRASEGESVGRLTSDWNTVSGWSSNAVGRVPVSPEDAAEFSNALSQLDCQDVAEYCVGCTPEECLRCAALIREFIDSRLTNGLALFIEED